MIKNSPSRGTADMIFTARQLQEKCCEQRQPLYMAFIDLTKAFDMVDRQALWSILSMYGCHWWCLFLLCNDVL